MPKHLSIPGRGGNLLVDGKLLEGVDNLALPGSSAPKIPAVSIISESQEFLLDIPNPGAMAFRVDYNPADDLHAKLNAAVGENQQLAFTWRIQGKKVNSIVGLSEISGAGTCDLLTVAGDVGDLKLSSGTGDVPHPGDFLVKTGGGTDNTSDGEKLRVIESDFSVEGKIKLKLGKGQGNPVAFTGAPTVHATVSNWRIDRPAIAARFRGLVDAFGTGGAGGRIVAGQASITISGAVTYYVGTPSLVGVL